MKTLKIHLKLKGRAICGLKRQKNPLRFAVAKGEETCGRCKRAVQT